MKLKKWVIVLILVLFPALATAEFYKYRDKDGAIRFTDDLSKVPENQRAGVREYPEYKTDTSQKPEDMPKAEKAAPAAAAPSESFQMSVYSEEAQKQVAALQEMKKRLDMKKQELTSEYQALMKEKEQLEKERKPASRAGANIFNKKVAELNQKIEEYEKKMKAFNAEVESYNAKIKEGTGSLPK